jgi:hypothetical protein
MYIRPGDWCEMAANLGVNQLEVSLQREDLVGVRAVGKEAPFIEDFSREAEE